MADAYGQNGAPVPTFEETDAALKRFVDSGNRADLDIYQRGKHLMDPNYTKTLRTKAAIDAGEAIAARGDAPPDTSGGASGSWGEPMTPEEVKTLKAPTGDGGEVADSSFADADPAGGAPDPLAAIRAKINRSISVIDSATGDYKKALIAQKDKLVEQERQIAGEQQEITDRADRRVRAMELMDQRQKDATAQADAEIRNAERMVTSHEIDPNRAFKTTGARVGSAIAIAMSALGQGMSGRAGPNTAYKIINDAINRDIDLQKEELRTRKDVLMNKNNLFANMMAKFGNERSAELATRQAGIAAAKQSLEALKAVHKGENAAMVIDSQIAQLTQAGEKGKMQLFQIQAQLAIADVNAQARTGVRSGKGGDSSLAKIRMAKENIKELKKHWKTLKEEGNIVEAYYASFLRAIGGPAMSSAWGTEKGARYENARTAVGKFFTNATDGGRPTNHDFAVIVAMTPASMIGKGKGDSMIGDLENILDNAISVGSLPKGTVAASYAQRHGMSPAQMEKFYQANKEDVESLKQRLGFKEGQ